MKKKLKQLGTQKGITFTKPELEIYEMQLGDIIDIEPVVIRRDFNEGEAK